MNKKIKKIIFSLIVLGLIIGTGAVIKIGDFEKLEGYMYSLAASIANSATSSNATSCNATSSNATSCNATSSNATSCNATSSNATSSNATTNNSTNNKKPVKQTSTIKVNTNENTKVEENTVTAPVEEVKDGDLEYNSSKITDEVINEIKNSSDKQNVIINLDGDVIIKKDVFEAIKGKEKQLTINSGIHQIIFNGKDITNPKDIDAKITYDLISEDSELNEISQKGVVINFADNGQLPGVATVRIKVNDDIRSELSMKNIFVYFYDANEKSLTKLLNKAEYNDSGYIQFSISHNSKYLFVNQEIKQNSEGYVDNTVNTNVKQDNEVSFLESYIVYIIVIGVSVILIIIVTVIVIVDRKKKRNMNE